MKTIVIRHHFNHNTVLKIYEKFDAELGRYIVHVGVIENFKEFPCAMYKKLGESF